MNRIVVDLGWVAELHGHVSDATRQLRTAPGDAVDIPSSPVLDGGMRRFMRRWDRRAGELADTLDCVGEFLDAVHVGFSQTDEALADATAAGDQ